MNFLQLCQRVAQESGVSRSTAGPVTVISQTGELGKIVDWVLSAYQDIQNRRSDWNFLRFDFAFPTIAASSTYLPSAVALTEHATWERDDMRVYLNVADEVQMEFLPWRQMKAYHLIGVVQSGKPFEFSIRPDKSLVLWPTPDAIYTISGEYWKRAQTMTANADEPLIPAQFHMAIVWRAVMLYAADQGASELYAHSQNEFLREFAALDRNQAVPIELAGALA